MKTGIYSLLNIKPAEARVVKQLFLVQFFLGVGTSFLFTSALTLFLATYPIKELPKVSLLAAGLLLGANYVYAALEAKLSPKKLLQVIILFSLGSIVFTWLEATFYSISWLPFFLSAWNMVLYMVMGYAFWGMAAIIFNVRESKRIFTVVGSGDIPAKILGYAAVAILAPIIGVINVLAISIVAFLIAYYYLNLFDHPAIVAAPDHTHHTPSGSGHTAGEEHAGFISRFFENNLILAIAIWSFVGFTIFSLLDYTFLTEIKAKYKTSHELASFLGIYFAVGRVLAMFIKLLFSSRVINRLGLANSLLVTPIILLFITSFILLTKHNSTDILFIFGLMVLLSEVLKSTVQEPAFFILFQPLHPHARLKGHLITKGYTMPFALLAVGVFAFAFRDPQGEISIALVCRTLVLLIAIWSGIVFLIKKEYLHTLIQALKKGYFTGTQLFLSDKPVRELLLAKTSSEKPKEVLFSLELLERSGYKQLDTLLLRELENNSPLIIKYVLSRITHRSITAALPIVEQQLSSQISPETKPDLLRAFYYLSPEQARDQQKFKNLDSASKKAALLGLASRPEPAIQQLVEQEVTALASSSQPEAKLLALDIISAAPHGNFQMTLQNLLQDSSPEILKKAIETVGQVRVYSLWPVVLTIAAKQKVTGALQRAILHFGDAIFDPEHLNAEAVPYALNDTIIRTAGTVTGNLSTNYLLTFLSAPNQTRDLALAALYRKKADLTDAAQKEVTTWLEIKLEQTKYKINVSNRLGAEPTTELLASALKSEITQDAQLILQACALLYDRLHIERVLHLVKSRDEARLFNAIEMLELNIPKRYFFPVDSILEYALELQATAIISTNTSMVSSVIKEILAAPETSFNVWTKSVALYLIPSLKDDTFTQILTEPLPEENNPLLSETKKFVISQVEL